MKRGLLLLMATVLTFTGCTDPSTKVASHVERPAAASSSAAGSKPDQHQDPKDVPAIIAIPLAAVALPVAIVIEFLHLDPS